MGVAQDEVATCDETRTAAGKGLAALISVESRASNAWALNQHGQTVSTGQHYPMAPVGDMDLLD